MICSLPVVVYDDVTYGPDGLQVFVVAVRADIVKGLRGHGVAVRACKVNGNLGQRQRERENAKIKEDSTRPDQVVHAKLTVKLI